MQTPCTKTEPSALHLLAVNFRQDNKQAEHASRSTISRVLEERVCWHWLMESQDVHWQSVTLPVGQSPSHMW